MAPPKKFKVLRAVEYGTYTKKAENGSIIDSDIKRYLPGEAISLTAKEAERLLADGIVGEFDTPPKSEAVEEPKEK
jgi:hypothetical protein